MLSKKVFSEKSGQLLIGGEPLTKEMRDLLREQAKYLETSQLWEIMQSTIINEAYNIALIQSKNFEEVEIGKMLKHWGYVFENMIHLLSK